jgi:hypothetical protein
MSHTGVCLEIAVNPRQNTLAFQPLIKANERAQKHKNVFQCLTNFSPLKRREDVGERFFFCKVIQVITFLKKIALLLKKMAFFFFLSKKKIKDFISRIKRRFILL